ncbi:MAG TPA: polysaccharide deacetylase family protein, partial [Vicinamibacteria bacterium]|nr:polysaccharide deacetylase family protein [Vicinamibacteria bacterium]
YWLHRRILPAGLKYPGAVSDPRILVLAFDRIVAEPAPNKIAREELRRHLRALAAEGFVAVSLEALARFYERGSPLPEKSLLITFDHGYLSTYDAVDPVLRELQFPAVLFVMTERQERRDPFFVYWDRVERMLASGLWELGSHGHIGHDPIPVDPSGATGPFFLRARYLEAQGRVESWEEFRVRVQRDHERAREILSRRAGREIFAYAPPLRDVAGLSVAPEAHQAMREILESHYRVAFSDDWFGINDARSDPKRLKRLRVVPGLSSEDLVRRVNFSMGRARADEASWTAPWVAGSGEATLAGGELVVKGRRRADLWRAGSQWVEDWELEGEAYIGGGELWVVQHSDDGPREWRFGGTAGRTYLQTRSPDERTEVIASFPKAMTPSRWHHVRVIKRGTGVFVSLDGETLGEHPVYLPGRWRGNVGIVHWNPGEPGLRLRNVRFRAVPFEARGIASSLPPGEVQTAIADAPHLAAISPRLFRIDPTGLRREPTDTILLRILVRRFGWELVPTLRIENADPEVISAALADVLAEASGFSGLRVEWSGVSDAVRKTVASALESRARALSWKEGRLSFVEAAESEEP